MEKRKVIIKNKTGLHARPASLFVQVANKYLCDVYIESGNRKVDGKSIMGVMSLGTYQGEELTIITKGEDELSAIADLLDTIENKMIE